MDDTDPPSDPQHHTQQSSAQNPDKKPVVRGARACTVCRTAKMRCIGGDDQASDIRPCNRCKKAGVLCVFEKHRRGRKPGSKLSNESKLRRLDKEQQQHATPGTPKTDASGPQSAPHPPIFGPQPAPQPPPTPNAYPKLEDHSDYKDPSTSRPRSDSQPIFHQNGVLPSASTPSTTSPRAYPHPHPMYNQDHFKPHENHVPPSQVRSPVSPQTNSATHDDDDSPSDESVFPQQIVARERNRMSFLATVLRPSTGPAAQRSMPNRREPDKAPGSQNSAWEPPHHPMLPACFNIVKEELKDPVDLGLLSEPEATELLAQVFRHMNPFVALFDPRLHTVPYIRSRSAFLFTVLMSAACKFFKPELYKPLQRMAFVFASRALDEQWKSIEVVQAFCCLVYWKEPEDNRGWAYVGYACRMAVELGLNAYSQHSVKPETDLQWRERRNAERTYLVLFVHDRSLSMQTGRLWMLPEDELVRNSATWHQVPESRPEDVIVAAFVQLRRLSAETSNVFHLRRNSSRDNSDVNYEVLLNGCNTKLTDWMEFWDEEMNKAHGTEFHKCLLRFFRLHVRLFLNSLGLSGPTSVQGGTTVSLQALSFCYTSAKETLEIVAQFARLQVLKYGQDVITVMSAYAAIFLLRLLRRNGNGSQSNLDAEEIYRLIRRTAGAFWEGVVDGPSAMSARAHARFLVQLVPEMRPSEEGVQPTVAAPPNTMKADEVNYSGYPPNGGMATNSPVAGKGMRGVVGRFATFGGEERAETLTISAGGGVRSGASQGAPPPPPPQPQPGAAQGPMGQGVEQPMYYPPHNAMSGPPRPMPSGSYTPASSMTMGGTPPGHMRVPSYGTIYGGGQQPQPQGQGMYAGYGGQEYQQQMFMQMADPNVDPQYTRHMLEQLGIRDPHQHQVPYAAPSIHDHFPVLGMDPQIYNGP